MINLGEDNWNEIGDDNQEPLLTIQNDPLKELREMESIRNPGTDFISSGTSYSHRRVEEEFPSLEDELEWRSEPRKRKSDHHPLDYYMHMQHGTTIQDIQKSKKAKLEKDFLDRMQDRIEQLRAAKAGISGTKGDNTQDGVDAGVLGDLKNRLFNFPPSNAGNWVGITGPNSGKRRYAITKRDGVFEKSLEKLGNYGKSNFGWLLGCDFSDLKRKAANILEVRDQKRNIERDSLNHLETLETLPLDVLDMDVGDTEKDTRSEDLWVEKYKPKIFVDLLSDDGINRTLLTWLKLWDECVFGREVKRKPSAIFAPQQSSDSAGSSSRNTTNTGTHTVGGENGAKGPSKFGGKEGGKGWGKFTKKRFIRKTDAEALSTELDKYKRPQIKIALLCGSPGLGKTTLAHVIARHAGYHVVEMNASDDRNIEAFRVGIEKATTFKSTLDAEPRPNCLIIDEIDGSPANSVNYLTDLVKGLAKVGPAKKKHVQILKRPIICICNDLYAPALRELRKVALVLNFPETNPIRLTDRLSFVCRREEVRAEHKTLAALCDFTSQDIRACLNTLQFASKRNEAKATVNQQCKDSIDMTTASGDLDTPDTAVSTGRSSWNLSSHFDEGESIRMADVKNSVLGQKDAQRSLFDVWHQIFEIPNSSKKRPLLCGMNLKTASNAELAERCSLVLKAAFACGEDEKIRQGIFDNYLKIKEKDPRMESTRVGTEWLSFMDEMNGLMMRSQNYTFLKYTPFLPVLFHLLCAQTFFPKIQFPHSHSQMVQKLQQNENIFSSVLDGADVRVRCFNDKSFLLRDVLPFLTHIIKPQLRPVNTQLYSAKEKEELVDVVSVMIHYNLTYRQQRSADGQFNFVLEPSVENVTNYPEIDAGLELPSSAKQMIAREVELERLRRSESAHSGALYEKEKAVTERSKLSGTVKTGTGKITLENTISMKEAATKSFFAPKKRGEESVVEGRSGFVGEGVWFKYNEGSSNAIRRNIRIKDLL